MQIRAHLSISADGFVTAPDGWPSPEARLTLVRERALPGGSVEILYAVEGRS